MRRSRVETIEFEWSVSSVAFDVVIVVMANTRKAWLTWYMKLSENSYSTSDLNSFIVSLSPYILLFPVAHIIFVRRFSSYLLFLR